MTTEEKAKAYDEAIKRAKALYDNHQPISGNNVIINNIFPELKESEDEIIRKVLVGFFKSYKEHGTCGSETFNGIPTDNIIAWLEKQGEYANFRNKIQVGDKVTRNEDGVLVNLSQLKRVAKPNEKQNKQKPTDVITTGYWHVEDVEQKPTDEEMKRLLQTEYEKGRADAIAEMQKEWSEEDKAKRNALIGLVEEIKGQPLKRLEDWDGYISWLKSLRPQNNITDEELAQAKKNAYNDALDKIEYHSGEPTFDDGWSAAIWYLKKRNIQPQSKQEWDEKDEMMLSLIIDNLKFICDTISHDDKYVVNVGSFEGQIDWLKSLKSQIDWLKSLRPKNR